MDGPSFGVHVAIAILSFFQRLPRRRQEFLGGVHELLASLRLVRNLDTLESTLLYDMYDT